MVKGQKKNLFVGIDLGGKTKATTGLCILQEANGELFLFPEYCKACCDLRSTEVFKVLKSSLGETRYLGYKDGFLFSSGARNQGSEEAKRGGLLFLPAMSFWKKEWRQKFYQAWKERDRLKYRYLTTNIFDREL